MRTRAQAEFQVYSNQRLGEPRRGQQKSCFPASDASEWITRQPIRSTTSSIRLHDWRG